MSSIHSTSVTWRRIVRSPKRKRKLQQRGELLWWVPSELGWVWFKTVYYKGG